MSTAVAVPPPNSSSLVRRLPRLTVQARALLTAVNLHYAGVAALLVITVYCAVHLFLVWQALGASNADALASQRANLRAAQIAAAPLRGMDEKLATSTKQADVFSVGRLPYADSQIAAELHALTKRANVRLSRIQLIHGPGLAGPDPLTEVKMDASISGDYRPTVEFVNSLERDRMFFMINGIALTGQQTGQVNLRLRMTTYLRLPSVAEGLAMPALTEPTTDPGPRWRRAMKAGAENRKKTIAAGALGAGGLVCLFVIYNTLFAGPDTPAPASTAPVVTTSAKPTAGTAVRNNNAQTPAVPGGAAPGVEAQKLATATTGLDPRLDQAAMLRTESLVYSGTGAEHLFGYIYAACSARASERAQDECAHDHASPAGQHRTTTAAAAAADQPEVLRHGDPAKRRAAGVFVGRGRCVSGIPGRHRGAQVQDRGGQREQRKRDGPDEQQYADAAAADVAPSLKGMMNHNSDNSTPGIAGPSNLVWK